MSDVAPGAISHDYPEIMRHYGEANFKSRNRCHVDRARTALTVAIRYKKTLPEFPEAFFIVNVGYFRLEAVEIEFSELKVSFSLLEE